jgi:hypothetical protein
MKIFRDEVYRGMRIVFMADHREYPETGAYDFRCGNPRSSGRAAGVPDHVVPLRQRWMRGGMVDLMLKPYERVLAESVPRNPRGSRPETSA